MEQKIRILHVVAGGAVGGAETMFLDTTTSLATMPQFEQMVVTRPVPFRLQELAKAGVPYLTANFRRWWPFATTSAIKKAIKQHKPHIVQYWLGRAGQFAVQGAHINVAWYGGYYKTQKRFAKCQHHVVITHDLVRHVANNGVPAQNISLLHCFSNLPQTIVPQNRAEFDTPTNAVLLVALARLHWTKGLEVLLDALKLLPQNFYVWLVGEGPLRGALQQQAETLGVANRVRFLGWRNDRESCLKAADICVIPSRSESFGNVMTESWGLQVPVVAAAAKGPKAYVRDGQNGMLVPMEDAPSLAKAIEQVAGDAALRATIVAGGLADYEAHFSPAAFKQHALAMYQQILAQHHAAAAA